MAGELQNLEFQSDKDRILLMGGPNVGKSVFFSQLTGVYVVSSNYTGTTVSYMHGDVEIGGKEYHLIDVPGTYTMSATSDAERVAVDFLNSDPKAILFVLDATNLAGGLRLATEVRRYGIPIVYALNMLDVAERQGITIDVDLLSQELGAPVVPTVAVEQKGFDDVKKELTNVIASSEEIRTEVEDITYEGDRYGACYWNEAQRIDSLVSGDTLSSPNWLDKLGDAMMEPWPGIPIALIVMLISISLIVSTGEFIGDGLIMPVVDSVIVPFFTRIVDSVLSPGILRNVLVGEYGIFVISFEWILALITPYIIIFYIVFSFLEDSGYMPRLAVLFDNIMSRIGVQGGSLIYVMLGFGCTVPAIIGTRAATTKKERLMITAMLAFSIPCISQMGALMSLTANHSIVIPIIVTLIAAMTFFIVGIITSKLLPGEVQPLVLEIPNLLLPDRKAYTRKLKSRIQEFMVEAQGPMLFAVLVAAVFKETGMINWIAGYLEPVMSGWLGMPEESVIALILGIVRREMAVAPLLKMNLTGLQVLVGSVVAMLYLPCLSVFGILSREFSVKFAVFIAIATTANALLVGGIVSKIGIMLGF